MTILDIAKETGFSTMTVSRVLNEPDKVRPATREKILKKIREMGYVPNAAAKSLASKCTNVIYVYIPPDLGVEHPFVMQVVTAIGERLGESGYSFYLSRKFYTNESCDGIIAMGLTLEEEAELTTRENGKPFVYFGNSTETGNWVDVDNYAGSRMITEYILNKGYRDVAYIGVSQSKRYASERRKAFDDTLAAAGISPQAEEMVDNRENCGYEAAKRILHRTRPRAIVCASDLLAIGCIRAIRSEGLAVPQDIAVAGFDGLGYETLTYPHITTIAQPIYEVGIRLADSIIHTLKNNQPPKKGVYIEPKLVVNESA